MPTMAENVPQDPNKLQPQDARQFALDKSAENNLLELDLTWSDEEIQSAMRYCAMWWNGTPPAVDSLRVKSLRLPQEYPFLVGTVYHMYLMKIQEYQRNDITYDIGGVQTNTFKDRIKHFQNMLNLLREEFRNSAQSLKTVWNLNNAWGPLGYYGIYGRY